MPVSSRRVSGWDATASGVRAAAGAAPASAACAGDRIGVDTPSPALHIEKVKIIDLSMAVFLGMRAV
jgi:hypothetical protein